MAVQGSSVTWDRIQRSADMDVRACWSPDAFPQFKRKYGEQLPNGDWEIPAQWQAGLSNVRFAQPSIFIRGHRAG